MRDTEKTCWAALRVARELGCPDSYRDRPGSLGALAWAVEEIQDLRAKLAEAEGRAERAEERVRRTHVAEGFAWAEGYGQAWEDRDEGWTDPNKRKNPYTDQIIDRGPRDEQCGLPDDYGPDDPYTGAPCNAWVSLKCEAMRLEQRAEAAEKAAELARDALDRLMGDSDLPEDDSVQMRAMRAIADLRRPGAMG